MTITQLKARLVKIAKRSRTSMAPLLYQLRAQIKKQGKAGEGFGAWVEEHLDITRRTADRWADEWAVSKGLKKPSKSTSRQMTKGGGKTVDGKVTLQVSFVVTAAEQDEFVEAMSILGPDAEPLIYTTVINAAKERKNADRKRVASSGADQANSFAARA
jgi:hypothetical protein